MKKAHGGQREGAGRKPKDTIQLSLKVPSDVLNALNTKFVTVKKRNVEIVKTLKKLSK